MAFVASPETVAQRSVEFTSLLGVIWFTNLGTILTVGSGERKVVVPAGVEVQSLEEALSRCKMCLLLWDESIRQSAIDQLENSCQTGGWLLFVSCPWTGGTPGLPRRRCWPCRTYKASWKWENVPMPLAGDTPVPF